MIPNDNSRDSPDHPTSKLRVIGYFPIKHEPHPNQISIHPQTLIHDSIAALINKRKFPYLFQPTLIAAQLSCIALIDTEHRAWLITDFLSEPLCISELLRKKVYSLSLSSSQLIVQTNTGHVLLNWGRTQPLHDQLLQKMTEQSSKHKESHFFQIYHIRNSKRDTRYYFSMLKKVIDRNSLYAVQSAGNVIRGYPQKRQIRFQRRVLGLSVGKHYKLCWDEAGKLYSWGCKSIGLGHATIPDEDYITEPREVQLSGHVIKAYADLDYSLAITLDGKLYEWGVKTIDANQQIILQPKQIETPSLKHKCIDLKGNYSKYGVLTLSGQLFIWGKNAKQFFNKQHNPLDWQCDNTITSPTLLPQTEDSIIDFEISESFILLIVNKTNCPSISHSQRRYWLNLKENIRDHLTLRTNLKTQASEQDNTIRKQRLSDQKNYTRKMKRSIEVALSKRKSKQEYLAAAALNSDKTIQYIMEPTQRRQQTFNTTQDYQSDLDPLHLPAAGPKQSRINPRFNRLVQQFQKEKDYVRLLVNRAPNEQRHKIARLPRNASQKQSNYYNSSKTSKTYNNRLMDVLKKKEKYDAQSLLQTIKKVENRSFEYRVKKIEENEQHRKKLKEIQIYKHTIQSLLVKHFLVRLLCTPLPEAREIKIANFGRTLKLARLQKNIRSLFTKARVKFQLQKLQSNQIFRFFLLITIFRTYVKRFRLRKQKNQRKLVVHSCLKSVVKEKIKMGVAACIFNIRKLQKFREWLTMVRQERQRCLKYLWKVHLLSLMKINCDNESSAIFYLPKNIEELTFESLYQDRVTANPLLNLKNFLNKFSIFRIKANYFQKLVTLFSLEQKKSRPKDRTGKFTIFGRGRKVRIKLYEDESDKQNRLNLMQTDVLPYSLHYNLLIHPKNYDLALSEMAKFNEKWIKFERTLLEKYINLIITSHQQNFLDKKRQHDVELAHFIRKNYDQISQKRWKFILEYNQIDKNTEHDKKERQLRRLMKIIAATNILDEDCIPQQQYILEEAQNRYDAPTPPNPYLLFGTTEFKKLFRLYYDQLSTKVKQLKRVLP